MTDLHARIASSFAKQSFMTTIGATLTMVADGEVHITLPYSERLCQQQGFMHAGAITSVVDSACGYAALTRIPEGHDVVSAEFKVNLMRPGIGDRFVAVGKVQNAGRLLTVCTGEVRAYSGTGPDYKVVALMQATMVAVSPS